MIKGVALAIFGWFQTPERFVRDCGPYIKMCLKERGRNDAEMLSGACCVALSQLAYLRAAGEGLDQRPRFRNYVRQMEKVSAVVAQALAKKEIDDERVKSILLLHRVI